MKLVELDARETFRNNLKRLLRHSGIEQKEIALTIGVSTSAVSDWVSGKSYPRIDAMERLAQVFHVPVEVLVGRYEPDWRSYLCLAYQNGTFEQRSNVCKSLNLNYFAVGDDRELVGLTKILISYMLIGINTPEQAHDILSKFYVDSKTNGKIGCSNSTYTICLEALLTRDESKLDKLSFCDDIEDDNSAIATLRQLTGHPHVPHVGMDLDEYLSSRSDILRKTNEST